METLIYCAKRGPFLCKRDGAYELDERRKPGTEYLNGTVCGLCDVSKAEAILRRFVPPFNPEAEDGWNEYSTKSLSRRDLLVKARLMTYQIEDYIGYKKGWAYFIGVVQEFGPYTIEESVRSKLLFKRQPSDDPLLAMPQSYCFAYRRELKTTDGLNYRSYKKKILILTDRSENVMNMLNKLKTVELRTSQIKGGDITYE